MRITYLVCYDIANDKRLRKVFKVCKNFGDHLQFSVFECDLNATEKVRLEAALKEIIDCTKDQVMFVGESTYPGRIFKVTLEGKVLGVIGKSGRNLKEFSGGHQLACPSATEIYVAESSNWRVQKLLLKP